MAPIPISPRVLSIQSHVVSGYCGNKSAVFPLQLLEFEVDFINSVQLSNNTQYKVTQGQIFECKHLVELHAGLVANNIVKLYGNILTGYVAGVAYIETMSYIIKDIKEERMARGLDCWYTLDPVLGDDGVGYYVPNGSNVAEAYKKYLLPLADIVTPNRFETSILTGVNINPESKNALGQAVQAINVFHKQMGIRVVVITSLEIASNKGELVCILSNDPNVKQNSSHGKNNSNPTNTDFNRRMVLMIRVPKLDCPFTGTGDMFTALLTGWLHKTQFDFRESLENTVNSLHEILEDTLAYHHQINDGSVLSHELRLVQNREKIISPNRRFTAVDMTSYFSTVTTNGDKTEC